MNERIQVLDHGYVELIDVWGSDQRVIEAARMSTQKGFEGWGHETGQKCPACKGRGVLPPGFSLGVDTEESRCEACRGTGLEWKVGDEKLLAYLWKNKHATPFEMAGVTIEVQAPIFVFREWHRHRVPFGYNEASARYAPLPDLNYVPTTERLLMKQGHVTKQAGAHGDAELTPARAAEIQAEIKDAYATAEATYQHALAAGTPKELARLVLPVGRYSKMRATANLRGWLSFLSLRLPLTAQYEIRQYAGVVHAILTRLFPRTIALFDSDFGAKR